MDGGPCTNGDLHWTIYVPPATAGGAGSCMVCGKSFSVIVRENEAFLIAGKFKDAVLTR